MAPPFRTSTLNGGAPTAVLPEKAPIHVEWEVCGAPEVVWTFWKREKPMSPAGIRTLDRPAREVVIVFTVLSRFPSDN
jgi:hypothetical protein